MNRKWVALLTAAVMLGTAPGMQVWAEPEETGEEQQQTEQQQTEQQQTEQQPDGAEISTQQLGRYAREQSDRAGDTLTVHDADGLMSAATHINQGSYRRNLNINLEADIDLSGENWPGIGKELNSYCATFNGNGHTVTLPAGSASLINYADEATVKDVIVKSNGKIRASEYCGAGCVGGVVGHINGGTIENCGNLASIEGDEAKSGWEHQAYVGGVVGYARGVTIQNCWNGGTVEGNGANYIGGIVGYMLKKGDKEGAVYGCFNFGAITGDNSGGIAGRLDNSLIQNCSNSGTVSGEKNVAGIVYHVSHGTVQYNQNTGKISGTDRMPIVGTIENNMFGGYDYYDGTDWTGSYDWGEARTREKLLGGSADSAPKADTWTVKKSFYPYLTAGGDRAKAQAAAAYVTEEDGTAYLNLSTEGSWKHNENETPLSFGDTCTLKDGDILTYSYGDYEKRIIWSGGEKTARVMFGAPAEDSLTFTVKVDDETVTAGKDGVYEIPYGSRVEIGLAPEGVAVSTDTKIWENMGLSLSGNGVTLSGTNSQKPAKEPVSAVVYGSNPAEGTWKAGTLQLRSVKALPKVNGLDFPGSKLENDVATLTYSGAAIEAKILLEENQENLNVEDMSVRWYVGEVNLDNPNENTPTGTAQGAETEGGAPVHAGDYYADVVYDGNDYYLPLGMTKGSGCPVKIQQKPLTEAMFGTTDWDTPELLNQEEAKKPVTGIDGGRKLVENKDYTLEYSDMTKPGTCQVIIKGLGNYCGEVIGFYQIAMGSYPIKLYPNMNMKEPYVLGGGPNGPRPNVYWILKSQPTVKYQDGISFWVSNEGSYEFTEVPETEQ